MMNLKCCIMERAVSILLKYLEILIKKPILAPYLLHCHRVYTTWPVNKMVFRKGIFLIQLFLQFLVL